MWFLIGLTIMLAAFFASHAGDLRVVQRMVSPEYVDALRGLRQLEIQTYLESGDRGFAQLSRLFLDRYRSQNPERDMAGIEPTRLERQQPVISVQEKNAPEVVPVTCLLTNGQKIEWSHAELMDAITQYKSKVVFWGSFLLFIIGALVQFIAFALDRRSVDTAPAREPAE